MARSGDAMGMNINIQHTKEKHRDLGTFKVNRIIYTILIFSFCCEAQARVRQGSARQGMALKAKGLKA